MQFIQTVFLVLVALVIPAFFALLFVMSAYHRLAALRSRCERIVSEADAVRDPTELARLRQAYDEAVAAYEKIRLRFPGSRLAAIFRFAPPIAWPPSKPTALATARGKGTDRA